MKRVTLTGENGSRSVKNVLKKGFSTTKYYIYKRHSLVGDEEYACLRRTDNNKVGWVSILGGSNYTPAFNYYSYKDSLELAADVRKVYEFNSLEEFLKNKHKIEK